MSYTINDPIRFTADIGNPKDPLARKGDRGTVIKVQPWCYAVVVDGREYLRFAVDENEIELFK